MTSGCVRTHLIVLGLFALVVVAIIARDRALFAASASSTDTIECLVCEDAVNLVASAGAQQQLPWLAFNNATTKRIPPFHVADVLPETARRSLSETHRIYQTLFSPKQRWTHDDEGAR